MRKVASQAGMKYYNLPMGAPITADAVAKARLANGGKPAPKSATKQSAATRSSTVARSQIAKEQAARAASARKTSPTLTIAPPPKVKPGKSTVESRGVAYKVKPESRTFKLAGSDIQYNVDSSGKLRVLTPKGEVELTPEQESRVKALMVRERQQLEENTPSQEEPEDDSDDPAAPKGDKPDDDQVTTDISPAPDQESGRIPVGGSYKGVRVPDSLGSSVSPEEEDSDAMAISPFSSKHLNPDGTFTAEREALHDEIIARFLDGVPPQENPTQYMNGGGPASGKGTMTTGDNAKITGYPTTHRVDDEGNFVAHPNPTGVIIDPDQLKLSLPEAAGAVKARSAGEPLTPEQKNWAANIHAESSHLGKRLQQAALERGVHLILDGVNNNSAASVKSKVAKARELGYRVEANYVYTDPEAAVGRARKRGERSGRVVPEKVIVSSYAKLPSIFDELKEGVFDTVRLFDNNSDGAPASVIGEGGLDGFNFPDETAAEAYKRYLASAAWASDRLTQITSGAKEAQQANLKDLASK